MHTEIWAHRGASHKQIENSLVAFNQAIADGAEGIELDVQRTKDGKLIVYHDENVKRLTGVNKFVWELTWSEVQELRLQETEEKIPSLEEVLVLMKNTNLLINIELKNSLHVYHGMEEEIFTCVKKFEMQEQVLYSSFNHESMARMVNLTGAENCAILTSDILSEPWQYVEDVGVKVFHPMMNSLQQKDLMQNCRERGIKVHVWTADEEALIYMALLLGVDALITNKPEKAIQLREQFLSDGGRKAVEHVKSIGFTI